MTHSDASLVRLAVAGEARAFDELLERYRPGLVRALAAFIGDSDEAESLAQEALTRAYTRLADFRPEMPFGAWLHGIGLNLGRRHLRERARHARPTAPDQLGEVAAPQGRDLGVLSGILRREIAERLREAVGELPEPLRQAFVLHYVEGMDYGVMSRLTGVAEGTLRVRAHRSRTLLRDHLGPVVDTWLRSGR
jgi:RNA polymerase sigma-70 factor (ECF subfamily)